MTTRRPTRPRTATTGSTVPLPLVPMPASAPEPVRAGSIGLALLRAARVQFWGELVDTLRTDHPSAARLDGIDLTRDDLALLDRHLGLLGLIRVVPGTRGPGTPSPSRSATGAVDAQHRRRAAQVPAHRRLYGRDGEGCTGQAPETCCAVGRFAELGP